MMKKKKALAMSVLCAVASVGFVMGASAETMHERLLLREVQMYCRVVSLLQMTGLVFLAISKRLMFLLPKNSIPKKLLQPFMIRTSR